MDIGQTETVAGRIYGRLGFEEGEALQLERVYADGATGTIKDLETLCDDGHLVIDGKVQAQGYLGGFPASLQVEHHLLPGGLARVQGPAGLLPGEARFDRLCLEIPQDKSAVQGGQSRDPLFQQVASFLLPLQPAYLIAVPVYAYLTLAAYSAKHTLARHAVHIVGGGQVGGDAQSAPHHSIGYDYTLAIGRTVYAGPRLLGCEEPVEGCLRRCQFVEDWQLLYLLLQGRRYLSQGTTGKPYKQ